MKQAWQPVASVAMSTIPPRTRSRSSEEETVWMTAYSVSVSRWRARRALVAQALVRLNSQANPPFLSPPARI